MGNAVRHQGTLRGHGRAEKRIVTRTTASGRPEGNGGRRVAASAENNSIIGVSAVDGCSGRMRTNKVAELIPGPLDIPRKTVPSQSSAMERVSEAILQTCNVDGIAVTRDASMGVPVDGESRSVFTPRSAFVGRPDDHRGVSLIADGTARPLGPRGKSALHCVTVKSASRWTR